MSEKAVIKIDSEKLKKAILKRNLTNSVIQKKLGRESGYISKITKRGSMTPSSVALFELVFGIAPEEYVLVDSRIEQEENTESAELDYGKLYQVIYDAVYTAVKKAWENE